MLLIDRLVDECVVAYFYCAIAELAPRPGRPAHRPAQPPGVLRTRSSPSSRAPRATCTASRARLLRPRPLQGGQRHARPSRGRPRAAASGRSALIPARKRLSPARMGGDEFAAYLVESDADAGGHYRWPRLNDRGRRADRARGAAAGARSAPVSRTFPTDGATRTRSSASPTRRLYESKRASAA